MIMDIVSLCGLTASVSAILVTVGPTVTRVRDFEVVTEKSTNLVFFDFFTSLSQLLFTLANIDTMNL